MRSQLYLLVHNDAFQRENEQERAADPCVLKPVEPLVFLPAPTRPCVEVDAGKTLGDCHGRTCRPSVRLSVRRSVRLSVRLTVNDSASTQAACRHQTPAVIFSRCASASRTA